MKPLLRREAIVGLTSCLVTWAVPAASQTQEPAPAAPAAQGSGTSCIVSGSALIAKDALIHGAASGDQPIAKFTGASAPLKATNFPHDVTTGRVQINTGAGFRIEGFMDPRQLPVYAARDLSVVPGHIWISTGHALRIVGATPGQLQLELPAAAGLAAPIRTTTSCDALTFSRNAQPPYEVEGYARGYLSKQSELNIYGSAGGDPVYTLRIAGDGSGLLFWGKTMRNGFVHVTSRSSIYVDGWVKLKDVRALPRGELMDQLAAPDRYVSPAQLALNEFQREMRSPKEIKLYFGRGEATPIIGVIEPDAEIYVLETVVGWASVLPKKLHVLPVADRAFWVQASALEPPTAAPPADAGADAPAR